MPNKKVGIITQARMTSTRLPGKVLKKVNGTTLLEYQIRRLREAGVPCVVATTLNETDSPIVDLCKQLDISFYRGSESDVLSRYFEAAKLNGFDVIVRVTSDCPLIDGALIKQSIDEYLTQQDDLLYMSNCQKRTFPRGMDFEIFSFGMLEAAFMYAKASDEREHVTPFIWRNKDGRFHLKSVLNKVDWSKYRLTVDEESDFALIERLIGDYDLSRSSVGEIVNLLERHPMLVTINSSVEQKKV